MNTTDVRRSGVLDALDAAALALQEAMARDASLEELEVLLAAMERAAIGILQVGNG